MKLLLTLLLLFLIVCETCEAAKRKQKVGRDKFSTRPGGSRTPKRQKDRNENSFTAAEHKPLEKNDSLPKDGFTPVNEEKSNSLPKDGLMPVNEDHDSEQLRTQSAPPNLMNVPHEIVESRVPGESHLSHVDHINEAHVDGAHVDGAHVNGASNKLAFDPLNLNLNSQPGFKYREVKPSKSNRKKFGSELSPTATAGFIEKPVETLTPDNQIVLHEGGQGKIHQNAGQNLHIPEQTMDEITRKFPLPGTHQNDPSNLKFEPENHAADKQQGGENLELVNSVAHSRIETSKAFEVLDLPNTASCKTVRSKYMKMVKKLRPDRNTDTRQVKKFIKVQDAFEKLKEKCEKMDQAISIDHAEEHLKSEAMKNSKESSQNPQTQEHQNVPNFVVDKKILEKISSPLNHLSAASLGIKLPNVHTESNQSEHPHSELKYLENGSASDHLTEPELHNDHHQHEAEKESESESMQKATNVRSESHSTNRVSTKIEDTKRLSSLPNLKSLEKVVQKQKALVEENDRKENHGHNSVHEVPLHEVPLLSVELGEYLPENQMVLYEKPVEKQEHNPSPVNDKQMVKGSLPENVANAPSEKSEEKLDRKKDQHKVPNGTPLLCTVYRSDIKKRFNLKKYPKNGPSICTHFAVESVELTIEKGLLKGVELKEAADKSVVNELISEVKMVKKTDSKIKTLLTVRFYSEELQALIHDTISKLKLRKVFIKQIIEQARNARYNYDGILLDWSHPKQILDKHFIEFLIDFVLGIHMDKATRIHDKKTKNKERLQFGVQIGGSIDQFKPLNKDKFELFKNLNLMDLVVIHPNLQNGESHETAEKVAQWLQGMENGAEVKVMDKNGVVKKTVNRKKILVGAVSSTKNLSSGKIESYNEVCVKKESQKQEANSGKGSKRKRVDKAKRTKRDAPMLFEYHKEDHLHGIDVAHKVTPIVGGGTQNELNQEEQTHSEDGSGHATTAEMSNEKHIKSELKSMLSEEARKMYHGAQIDIASDDWNQACKSSEEPYPLIREMMGIA